MHFCDACSKSIDGKCEYLILGDEVVHKSCLDSCSECVKRITKFNQSEDKNNDEYDKISADVKSCNLCGVCYCIHIEHICTNAKI